MAPRNNQRSTPAQQPAPSRGASQAAVQAFVASNPNSRTAQAAAAPSQPKPKTLNQGLKIAGTGGITKQELQTISKTTGRSGAQVIQRLDALNQKLKGKNQVGISLNSGAANMLIRQAQKQPSGMFGMSDRFGTGQIGKALQGMLGTPGSAGYMRQGQMVGGQKGIPGTGLMMGGTAIRPGGRPTVRGFGKQFAGMPTSGEVETTPVVEEPTTATDLPVDDFAMPTMEEEKPKEEEKPQFMPGSFADLANWATGFKTARSSRKRSGPRAQGLASQRVNPTGAFRGGV